MAVHQWHTEWYEGRVIYHKFSTCVHCKGISWDAISKIGMSDQQKEVYSKVCTTAPDNFKFFLDKCVPITSEKEK